MAWLLSVKLHSGGQPFAGQDMSKKHLRTISAITIGGFSVFAVGHWPVQAVPIQMALYSAMVLGPLIFAFWSDWSRNRFWICIFLAPALHVVALFLIRPVFPFRSVLVVVPIALAEATVLATVVVKVLGEDDARESSQPNLS